MLSRWVVPAAAALMLASAGAMAAQMTPAQKCTALEKQFDKVAGKHQGAPKIGDARTLRADGGKLCAEAKYTDGISKLEMAFSDIGVKPSVR